MIFSRTKQRSWPGRFTASALLALFALLLTLPFLADDQSADATLPICGQAHGRHQCSLRQRQRGPAQSTNASTPSVSERCPFSPVAPASDHSDPTVFYVPVAQTVQFQSIVAPLSVETTLHLLHHEASNPKRGPPTSSIL